MKKLPHVGESEKRTELLRKQMSNKQGFRSGGRVKTYDAGAASGPGRLEKIENYGSKSRGK